MLVNSIDLGDRCQSKCSRCRLWWWRHSELTCFIMLPHYLEWRTPASFNKWTSRLHNSFNWILINNSLSNLKESNDQNRDSQHSRGPFSLAWQEIGLKLNLEISMAEKKKSLLSKWAYIVFWYLKSAGRGEVSNPDWKLYCQQNNSIAVHRLVVCLNRPNNSCYIHSN